MADEGMTGKLSLSVTTAVRHLYRTIPKLGVASRAELTRRSLAPVEKWAGGVS
ncbi:hypothetical protein [Nonomuraea typhae]|uniref:HTH luxR-type domain-containing protein n=1 Tax=Nonomuraea typhae TaxID=2603600 RepID=A0ABW7YP93_9ACTN